MKITYVKLEDEQLLYAPKRVKYKNRIIVSPNARVLKELGYKPLTFDSYPTEELTEEQIVIAYYEELEDEIRTKYRIEQIQRQDENELH